MAENTMFEDAVEALRQGNKARARELLTLLLKAEQNNSDYWIWMSAAADTAKERIYCLQAALRFDPENATAKRGLMLLGALPPDETIQPFPVNRSRVWEEKLLLAHEQPKPRGVQAVTSNPLARLTVIGVGLAALAGLVILGFMLPRSSRTTRQAPTFTPGPSPTFTLTPTVIGGVAAIEVTPSGPAPLWTLLEATFTATPPYVNTQRPPQSIDQYRAAQSALKNGDFKEYLRAMQEVIRLEGNQSADLNYQIAEVYRVQGNAAEALKYYNEALKVDNKFAAGYLGLARASLLRDPNAEVENLYDLALQNDPNYGEVYLERGTYRLYKKDAEAALADFSSAEKRMPDSPLVYYGMAQAYQLLGDTLTALEYAEKTHQMDITLLPNYLLLGRLYIDQERYAEAAQMLDTYVTYDPANGEVYALLGESAYKTGDCEKAIPLLTTGVTLDARQRQVYFIRAMCLLEAKEYEEAQTDIERGIPFTGETFEVKIGLIRAYYGQEKYGSAYQQAEGAMALAETAEQTALALYWRALSYEGRGSLRSALNDWKALLDLPESAMTGEMRATAEQHLKKLAAITPSATPKPSLTPTKTKTPPPSPTKKPSTPTPTPTRTPTP
jgi:tetratricopeptide (TPR) repeat protein